MKTVIFLIIMALVIAGMLVSMRKSQAKADLAREESLKRLKKERKKVLTPQEYAKWPVIIRPIKGDDATGTKTGADQVDEPLMTSIEYEPSEKVRA
jgi:hypothetical protein